MSAVGSFLSQAWQYETVHHRRHDPLCQASMGMEIPAFLSQELSPPAIPGSRLGSSQSGFCKLPMRKHSQGCSCRAPLCVSSGPCLAQLVSDAHRFCANSWAWFDRFDRLTADERARRCAFSESSWSNHETLILKFGVWLPNGASSVSAYSFTRALLLLLLYCSHCGALV